MKQLILAISSGIVLGFLNLPAGAQFNPPPPPSPLPMTPLGGPADAPAAVPLTAPPPPSFTGQQAPPYIPPQPAPSLTGQQAPSSYIPPPISYTPPPTQQNSYVPPASSIAPPPSLYPDISARRAIMNSDPIEQSFWSAGIGVYFMEPVFQSNPAFISGHTNTAGTANVYRQTDFSQNVISSPQAWLGYTWANGWGIRGRWFEFSSIGNASGTVGDQGAFLPGGSQLSSASTGDQINASSVLYGDVVDLEATYTMTAERWSLTASAGARYVHLNQSYSLSVFDPTNGTSTAYSTNNFDGVGPTVSFEGRHQIGLSAFALYGSVRGSIVFGEAHQWGNFDDPKNGNLVLGGHQTSVISIGELEMGVEWSRTFGHFRWFTQVGAMGQFWSGAGNPTQALSLSTANIAPGSNLGFIGGVLRGGVSF
jgi:hypothetical protein